MVVMNDRWKSRLGLPYIPGRRLFETPQSFFFFSEGRDWTFRTSRANSSTQPVAAIEISVPICASEREKSVCHKSFEANMFRQMCGTGARQLQYNATFSGNREGS
jgi:hypothetical protein